MGLQEKIDLRAIFAVKDPLAEARGELGVSAQYLRIVANELERLGSKGLAEGCREQADRASEIAWRPM